MQPVTLPARSASVESQDWDRHLSSRDENPFSLGHEDQLYCRSAEQAILKEVYQRVRNQTADNNTQAEFVLIDGAPGAGKTALAKSLRSLVEKDHGMLLVGKWDLLHRPEAYSAIIQAMTQFTILADLSGPKYVSELQRTLLKELSGDDLKKLCLMVPTMVKIIDPASLSSGEDDEDSFNSSGRRRNNNGFQKNHLDYAFRKLLSAVSKKHPIVFLLDDIQSADTYSMEALQTFMTGSGIPGVLYVATCNGDPFSVPLVTKLIETASPRTTNISLVNFREDQVAEFLSCVLHNQDDHIATLTEPVFEHTKGNILYILEYLGGLVDNKLLVYDKMKWEWDEKEVETGTTFKNVEDLITSKLRFYNNSFQETLKIAACLGYLIDPDLIAKIRQRESVAHHIKAGLAQGFLAMDPLTGQYRFSHDVIRKATYDLIKEEDKQAFHVSIGRSLMSVNPSNSGDGHLDVQVHSDIFTVLHQLKFGVDFIEDPKEREAVATLCLEAGELAFRSSNFHTASSCLDLGLFFLDPKDYWRTQYDLSLALYNASAEINYALSNFNKVELLVSEIIAYSRTYLDSIRARVVLVYTIGSRKSILEAIDSGLGILSRLGEHISPRPSEKLAYAAFLQTRKKLRSRSIESLERLPSMTNPEKIAAMQVLNVLSVYAYQSNPILAYVLALRIIHLSVHYGQSLVSSLGFAMYAALLCGVDKNYEEGYRYGEFAMGLCNDSKPWLARVSSIFYSFVYGWRKPISTSFDQVLLAHRAGRESGDIESSSMNAMIYSWGSFPYRPLKEQERTMAVFLHEMEQSGQESTKVMSIPFYQCILNLMGRSTGPPTDIHWGRLNQKALSLIRDEKDNKINFTWYHYQQMLLFYMFGDFKAAEKHGVHACSMTHFPIQQVTSATCVFFFGLTALALLRNKSDTNGRRNRKAIAAKAIKKFTTWSENCPENFLSGLFLLEAENFGRSSKPEIRNKARAKYTCAIALARHGGFMLEEALANELAGSFYLRERNQMAAAPYFRHAINLYEIWGAKAKVEKLRVEVSRSCAAEFTKSELYSMQETARE